jgi:hypothetical protein
MAEISTSEGRTVLLFSRTGCHLCEVARDRIMEARLRVPFRFEEILIDGSEELEREYGVRVPVVVVDGREEFEFEVEPVRLALLLG